jgi:hypothetical protein
MGFRYLWSSINCHCYQNNIYEKRAYHNGRLGRFDFDY